MAKTKISEFSTTPGNNTDINGINISEGCAPSGINNAIRELMSDLKEWQSGAMDVYVIPQGTAAAPGIQLYGDLDTGLYGAAANQLGVAVGGSSVGYFSSAGWVGNVVATTIDLTNIEVTNVKAKDGTTSISLADSTGIATFSKATVIETTDNTNAALRITQLGTGNALLVEDSTSPDATPTVIDQYGNVILGKDTRTSTVTGKVEIHSTSTDGAGLTPSLGFYNWGVASSTASALSFRHYPSGTVGTLAANTSGDILGRIVFFTYDGTNTFSASIRGLSGAGGASPSMIYDASGGHTFTSGPIDVENLEVTNIKAKDGTASATIADSTGVMTIASSVLTTTDINGGTIDGAVIGGSSAAAGTFTTITGTQVNGDNLRLDGNTLSSTDTNGNITIAPNGTGQVVMSGDLDVANIETTNIKAKDGTASITLADSTGVATFSKPTVMSVDSASDALRITQIGAGNALVVEDSANPDTSPFIVKADGSVGMGLTSPVRNIHISSSTAPGGGLTGIQVDATATGANATSAYVFNRTTTNASAAQTVGAIYFSHTLTDATPLTTAALISVVANNNAGANTGDLYLNPRTSTIFQVNGSSIATINANGIDTTNLEVTNIKAKDGTAALSIADSTGAVTVATALTANGGAVFNENGADVDFRVEGDTDANLIFADASTDRVGIGTNAPIGKLDVAEVNFANIARFSRNITGTNSIGSAVRVRTSTTGDMVDGFGTGLVFSIEDNAAVQNDIAFINAVRTGADNTGALTFSTTSAGSSTEKLRITSGGQVNIGGNFTSTNNTLQVTGNAAIGYTTAAPTTGLIVAGNVGVGTDAPTFKLEVGVTNTTAYSSTAYSFEPVLLTNLGAGGVSGLLLQAVSTGTANTAQATISAFAESASSKNTALAFGTRRNSDGAVVEGMRLDSSGNLGLGTTSPVNLSGAGDLTAQRIFASQQSTAFPAIGFASDTNTGINWPAADTLSFNTAGTERARITSGGYFKASNNGSYLNSTGSFHEFNQSTNVETLVARNTFATFTENVLYVQADRNTTNNSFYAITYYNAGAAASKFRVADSGNVTNTNGSYGTISDAKMKTDIVDAGSQWSDIKALRFRKFKMKDDPSGLVQLGVVAQEVEQTSPGLVDEHADKDAEGNDLGTTTKSVKTSVLLMKAAVALQEAMARIEKLEAEVAALKGV